MIQLCSDTSFANQNRMYMITHQNQSFPLVLMGRRSYLFNVNLEYFEPHYSSLIIGNYCSIAHGVTFMMNMNYTHDHLSVTNYPIAEVFKLPLEQKSNVKGSIIVGHDVWIGRGATIMPNVIIGNGAIISANAVVTKDVKPYSIVGGNPAKLLKYRFDENTRKKLNQTQWWYESEEVLLNNSSFINGDVQAYIQSNEDKLTPTECNIPKQGDLYVLIVSFETAYSVWKNVVSQYLQAFSMNKDLTLMLGLSDEISAKHIELELEEMIGDNSQCPNIEVMIGEEKIENMIKQATFYITERSHETLKYVQMAKDYGATILFGANKQIFS